MLILPLSHKKRRSQRGVTLLELIVFMVVVSVAMVVLLATLASAVKSSYDPVARAKAIEKGQALLDEILSRKFDENTPTGGVPACGSTADNPCLGIVPEDDFDDVGDYHQNPPPGYAGDPYPVTVSVEPIPDNELTGVSAGHARLITVRVATPGGDSVVLSVYRANF